MIKKTENRSGSGRQRVLVRVTRKRSKTRDCSDCSEMLLTTTTHYYWKKKHGDTLQTAPLSTKTKKFRKVLKKKKNLYLAKKLVKQTTTKNTFNPLLRQKLTFLLSFLLSTHMRVEKDDYLSLSLFRSFFYLKMTRNLIATKIHTKFIFTICCFLS